MCETTHVGKRAYYPFLPLGSSTKTPIHGPACACNAASLSQPKALAPRAAMTATAVASRVCRQPARPPLLPSANAARRRPSPPPPSQLWHAQRASARAAPNTSPPPNRAARRPLRWQAACPTRARRPKPARRPGCRTYALGAPHYADAGNPDARASMSLWCATALSSSASTPGTMSAEMLDRP